jgi:hypothetical protein
LASTKNTLVFYTTDNGAWQDVYPDAGYTPFRGTKGTVREGGNRVPAIAWMPGTIAAGTRNHDILGGLDLMATFASVAGVKLPETDREGQPIIFDSYDMTPVLFGTGEPARGSWFYFTEDELTPGAVRVGNYKAVFNLRGDNGAVTGGLAADTNLGWKGPEKYVATAPQIFDLWPDPQERYDIFMNNYTGRTWTMVTISDAIRTLMRTLYPVSPAKAAEHDIYGAHDDLQLSEVPVRARDAGQGGHQHSAADGQLTGSLPRTRARQRYRGESSPVARGRRANFPIATDQSRVIDWLSLLQPVRGDQHGSAVVGARVVKPTRALSPFGLSRLVGSYTVRPRRLLPSTPRHA